MEADAVVHEIFEAIDFIPSDRQTRPELVNEDEYELLDYSLLDRIVTPIEQQMALAA